MNLPGSLKKHAGPPQAYLCLGGRTGRSEVSRGALKKHVGPSQVFRPLGGRIERSEVFGGALLLLRRMLGIALLGLACVAPEAPAQQQATPAADHPAADHLVLPQPLPVLAPPAQIEVLGLFWYGCPHCYRLEPKLDAWVRKLPGDASFRRLPAVLTESWRPAARLHYTLTSVGALETLHLAVFEAEHATRTLQVQSRDPESFADWAARQGISKATWAEAWNSTAVSEQVGHAEELTRPLRRTGVPALLVDGRYVTTGTMAGSPERMLEVADRLIAQVRRERSAR